MSEFLSDPINRAFAIAVMSLLILWFGIIGASVWQHRQ